MYYKKGFTLVELLIVIVIIALLAAVVMVALGGVRDSARDARRLEHLKQLQTALELYRDDQGHYPQMQVYITRGNESSPPTDVGWTSNFGDALKPYLPFAIGDTSMWGYLYRSTNSGQKYGLGIYLDSPNWSSLAAGDGGCFSEYYEVGSAPVDCACPPGWWDKLPIGSNIDCP